MAIVTAAKTVYRGLVVYRFKRIYNMGNHGLKRLNVWIPRQFLTTPYNPERKDFANNLYSAVYTFEKQ